MVGPGWWFPLASLFAAAARVAGPTGVTGRLIVNVQETRVRKSEKGSKNDLQLICLSKLGDLDGGGAHRRDVS